MTTSSSASVLNVTEYQFALVAKKTSTKSPASRGKPRIWLGRLVFCLLTEEHPAIQCARFVRRGTHGIEIVGERRLRARAAGVRFRCVGWSLHRGQLPGSNLRRHRHRL